MKTKFLTKTVNVSFSLQNAINIDAAPEQSLESEEDFGTGTALAEFARHRHRNSIRVIYASNVIILHKELPMNGPIPASEFSRNFGRYQDLAISEGVVRVSSHGRIVGAFLSPQELDRYERFKRRERQVLNVGALPDDVIADIAASEYGTATE